MGTAAKRSVLVFREGGGERKDGRLAFYASVAGGLKATGRWFCGVEILFHLAVARTFGTWMWLWLLARRGGILVVMV